MTTKERGDPSSAGDHRCSPGALSKSAPLPQEEPRISVVIPALNEARNLWYVLTRLPRGFHEVIMVDGHSTDDTVAIARALYPSIRVIQQTGHGKGNALACGFAVCTGNLIVMLDADGSSDPAEIPHFIAPLYHGADFAKGSRFTTGGSSDDITRLRYWGNQALKALVNLLYSTHYTDLCYGFNAFWAHCLPVLNIDCDGFEVETLIAIRAAQAGLIVHEVPSYEKVRLHGRSNLRVISVGLRALQVIVLEKLKRSRARHNPTIRARHPRLQMRHDEVQSAE